MEILFLGSGGTMPTRSRSLPSVVVKRDGEIFMFDCGEGTQRQMILGRVGFNRKMRIFLSHMHGDHVFGLPGLLQSMALLGRDKPLEIYGPKGLERFVTYVNEAVPFAAGYDIQVRDIAAGRVVDEESYYVEAEWAEHLAPCLAYAICEKPRPGRFNPQRAKKLGVPEGPLWKKLQQGFSVKVANKMISPRGIVGPPRKGLKIVYVTDTRPSPRIVRLARNADLLIHDSCFDSSYQNKAREYGHSTAKEAASVARRARVKRLILTHLSAIYQDPTVLQREARKFFRSCDLASDLKRIDLTARN